MSKIKQIAALGFKSISYLVTLSLTIAFIAAFFTVTYAQVKTVRQKKNKKTAARKAQAAFSLPESKQKLSRRSMLTTVSSAFRKREAAKFAPIVYHQKDEVNWPVNVGWLMRRTSLWFYVKGRCNVLLMTGREGKVPGQNPRSITPLEDYMTSAPGERWVYIAGCGPEGTNADLFNAADRDKNRTYYLRTFGAAGRGGIGPENGRKSQWTTYVHQYENADGGATIQYWRVYSYQDFLPDFGGKHGGDWESVQIVLDAARVPREVRFLGHGGLDPTYPEIKTVNRPGAWDPNGKWGDLRWQDGHPLVFSQRGGHASKEFTDNAADFVEQKTWLAADGGLKDTGSFSYPQARWAAYSGLWGSPPSTGDDPDSSKGGWWGPAFNGNEEKDKTVDNVAGKYLTAWCEGMNGDEEDPIECLLKKPLLSGAYPDN